MFPYTAPLAAVVKVTELSGPGEPATSPTHMLSCTPALPPAAPDAFLAADTAWSSGARALDKSPRIVTVMGLFVLGSVS